jgi:hypothetical protein
MKMAIYQRTMDNSGDPLVEVDTSTRQAALELEPVASGTSNIQAIVRARPKPLPQRVTADDRDARREFVRTLDRMRFGLTTA